MRRILCILTALLAICAGVSSCREAPDAEAFLAPAFLSVSSQTGPDGVVLEAVLSSPRIEECGFLLKDPSGGVMMVAGRMEGTSFTAVPQHLRSGETYFFQAYALAGSAEVRSEESSFTNPVRADVVPIVDPAFKAWLLKRFDADDDGELSLLEARSVKEIFIFPSDGVRIQTLRGIEYMPNLWTLNVSGCGLTELDVTRNPLLRELICPGNLLTELDLSQNPLLETLLCAPMADASGNNLLDIIYISKSQSGNAALIDWSDPVRIPEETMVTFRPSETLDERIGMRVVADGDPGILFWVSEDGKSGLMVSTEELQWEPWAKAERWCRQYGSGGWAMPSISQLSLIHRAFVPVNQALKALGATPLCTDNYCYWSSTEYEKEPGYYYRERLWDGLILCYGSDEHQSSTMNLTRAVRPVTLSR